jgi:uncharacterized protein YcnI
MKEGNFMSLLSSTWLYGTTFCLKLRRPMAAAGLAAAMLVGLAGPASAHVTIDPGSAPQGGEITLGFRVPNEMAAANVTQVQIAFPTDHPLLGVETEPIAGWMSKVTEVKLNPPVQTDDGPVSQAASQITWTAASGGGTGPGQFQEFRVLVQRLPSNIDQVAFPTIQTYSDGTATSWIEPVDASHPNPDHPRPLLVLTPAAAGGPGTPTVTTLVVPAKLATSTSVTNAQRVGYLGVAAGVVGILGAIVALARRRRAG